MCKYCKVNDYAKAIINKTVNVLNTDINIELWLNGDMLTLSSGDDCVAIVKKKIKYCPMCGRRLKNV